MLGKLRRRRSSSVMSPSAVPSYNTPDMADSSASPISSYSPSAPKLPMLDLRPAQPPAPLLCLARASALANFLLHFGQI